MAHPPGHDRASLISAEYVGLNRELHQRHGGYGRSGHYWLGRILEILDHTGYESVLDYGAGKGTLGPYLELYGIAYRGYDPAVEAFAADPMPADLVVCLDVLEHIEPDRLDAVLADIARLAKAEAFLVVATRPATKDLPDGRNAHLIVQPYEWWKKRIAVHFQGVEIRQEEGHHFQLRATPKR